MYNAMTNQGSESSLTLIPNILEKTQIMLFAGDQDLICNYVGIEALISALTWNGGTGLGKVQTQSWTVDGVPAGTWVTSRNLTYVKVWNVSIVVFASLVEAGLLSRLCRSSTLHIWHLTITHMSRTT